MDDEFDIDESSEVEALMQEAPGGANYGRTRDGDRWIEHEEDEGARAFLRDGGWTVHGSRITGRPRGCPRERVTERGGDIIRERVGFTRDEFRAALLNGRRRANRRSGLNGVEPPARTLRRS